MLTHNLPPQLVPAMLPPCLPLGRLEGLSEQQQSEILTIYTHKFRSVAGKNEAIWNTPKFQRALFVTSVEQIVEQMIQQEEEEDAGRLQWRTQDSSASSLVSTTGSQPPERPELLLHGRDAAVFRSLSDDQQEAARQYCLQMAHLEAAKGETLQNPAGFFAAHLKRFLQQQQQSSSGGSRNQPSRRPARSRGTERASSGMASSSSSSSSPPAFELRGDALRLFESLSPQLQQEAQAFCLDATKDHQTIQNPAHYYASQLARFTVPIQDPSDQQPGLSTDVTTTTTEDVPEFELRVDDSLASYQSLSKEQQQEARQFCLQAAAKCHNNIQHPAGFYGAQLKVYLEKTKKKRSTTAAARSTTSATSTTAAAATSADVVPVFELRGEALASFESLSPEQQDTARQFCIKAAAANNGTKQQPAAKFYAALLQQYLDDDPIQKLTPQPPSEPSSATTEEATVPAFSLRGDALAAFKALPYDQQEEARQFCRDAAAQSHKKSSIIKNPIGFYGTHFQQYMDQGIR